MIWCQLIYYPHNSFSSESLVKIYLNTEMSLFYILKVGCFTCERNIQTMTFMENVKYN